MRVVELINRAIKGAKYEWSNFTAARVTWQQLSWDQDEGAPYTYKEEVRVARKLDRYKSEAKRS